MAEAKVKAGGNREETVNGRKVTHYADGSPSVYADTGEQFDRAAAEEYAILYPGDGAEKVKHEAINQPILFWVKFRVVEERDVMNPIRGIVLGFFEPPANFGSPGDDEDDEEEAGDPEVVRKRLACWFKLTLPTWVKNQNKEVILAPVGAIVWVDVTHANTALARAARPVETEDGGLPTGLVEAQVEPIRKVSFPSKTKKGDTWSAWRMRVSGGWRQATDDKRTGRKGGFRSLDAAQIVQLAHRMTPPEILDVEAAARLAGVNGPAAPALPPSAERSAPALPAHQTAN